MNGLQGTMAGQAVQTPAEADFAAIVEQARQAAAEAQAKAQAAGQEFQQAAAQPPPPMDASILGGLLPSLLANVGSVLGQTPAYREGHEKRSEMRRAEVMKARADNLQALMRRYENLAQAASQIGNTAAETDARTQLEKLHQSFQKVQDQMKERGAMERLREQEAGALERTRLQGEYGLKEAQIRAGAGAGTPEAKKSIANMAQYALDTGSMETVPSDLRQPVVDEIARRGEKILPQRARATLATLRQGRQTLNTLRELNQKLVKQGVRPKNVVERVTKGVPSLISAKTQTNPVASRYLRLSEGMLSSFARSTGERGTLTNQDIARARAMRPGLTDVGDVAEGLFNDFDNWISQQEDQIIANFSQPMGGRGGAAPAPAPAGARVRMVGPNGERGTLDASEVPDAVKNGWKRAP